MWILGIAGSHNGAVALTCDGEVVVAVQSERLSRIKRQQIFLDSLGADAWAAIDYCLGRAGIRFDQLDAIATSTPWRSVRPDFAGIPQASPLPRIVTVPHHLAHAEYVLHYFPGERALVLVCDGSGSTEGDRALLDVRERDGRAIVHLRGAGKESISAYEFDGRDLRLLYRVGYDVAPDAPALRWPLWGSLGHLWRWASVYCCGDPHEAGKVMGLAPYGDPSVHRALDLVSLDRETGEVALDFSGLRQFDRYNEGRQDITGDAHYQDIAARLQQVTSEFLLELVAFLARRVDTRDLCYSGGIALNGIANELIARRSGFRLHMNGSCEDNGTAIGAALSAFHHLTGRRARGRPTDCYGADYSEAAIASLLSASGVAARACEPGAVLEIAARAIASGQVVGWYQGRSEFGPRALGNRSILADPRDPMVRDLLNARVKRREAYRPYAPAVLEHRAGEFFDLDGPSPFMLRVVPVKGDSLPGVTHVDGSGRVQTVSRDENPRFFGLIEAFERLTGVPVVLNTSFNIAGEPIVETPEDALNSFIGCGMDLLVLGDHVVAREAVSRAYEPLDSSGARSLDRSDVLCRFWPVRVLSDVGMSTDVQAGTEEGEHAGDGARFTFRWRDKEFELPARLRPLIVRLERERRFVAEVMLGWAAADGAALEWDEVRELLAELGEAGVLCRVVGPRKEELREALLEPRDEHGELGPAGVREDA